MRAMGRFLLIAVGLLAATTFAASPANFGLSGGDEGAAGAPAVQDLFKSGPVTSAEARAERCSTDEQSRAAAVPGWGTGRGHQARL